MTIGQLPRSFVITSALKYSIGLQGGKFSNKAG
ncbi:unnamed protein product, partial [marine sediment metagenome]